MENEKDIKKTHLRRIVLTDRAALGPENRINKSRVIGERVINDPAFLRAETIFIYGNTEFEVSTKEIIENAWETGKSVALPRVNGKSMDFFYITSFRELKLSSFGVPEPNEDCPIAEVQGEILVIVPGVVFDCECNRIGYGGGYYDRFLSAHPHLPTIAIAFSMQMKTKIPTGKFDVKPDAVITEEQCYKRITERK